MLSWDDVMGLLTESGYQGKKTDFAVLRGMLAYLGSPEKHLRFVHVAGTNGKGSASRMMQAVLTAAGYRTGLFISPHLEYMNERWTIDGEMITDEELVQTAQRVRTAVAQYNTDHIRSSLQQAGQPAIQSQQDSCSRLSPDGVSCCPAAEKPVAFALLTLMAFDYFARKGCEIVVLEVGIGGRLDSTNVIPVPELALIMNIGLEHTELLGNTVEEIACEKGGIIKPGGRVVLYHQSEPVENVIRNLCRDRGAELVISEERQTNIRLNLSGRYQKRNMAALLAGIDILRCRGWKISEEAVRRGLGTVTWPGRFEILHRNPLVIVDGAHNPNGVEALVQNLEDPEGPLAAPNSRGRVRILFVFGAMADKDVREMLRLLAPYAAGFIMETVPDGEGRAETAEILCAEASRYFHGPVQTADSIEEALLLAVQAAAAAAEDTAVICCGSLYQVAEIRKFFGR